MIRRVAGIVLTPLHIATAMFVLCLALISNVANAAVYPLEIIAPRSGLTVENRYYKAYPGLVYEVDVAAVGGVYPYTYSLSNAPSGMTINAETGRITWSSPAERSSAYPVSVNLRDSAGASTSVSWSVLVTTSGFRFIDANAGRTVAQGGDGSRSNPWRSIADWYGSKYDTDHRGVFLYWRGGTYRTIDAPLEDGRRLALTGRNKPLVWLAYPGETPVIDTTGSHISIYAGSDNTYFDGLSFRNFTTRWGVSLESSGDNVQFRRNTFTNLPSGSGGTGSNASAIMISRGSVGQYWTIIDNQFSGIHDVGYGILGYNTDRVLVQGNRFTDFNQSESKAIGPKMGNSMWFIRDNRINISAGQGIWIDTYNSDSNMTRDIEVSYNLVRVGSGYTLWAGQEPATYGAITSLRNTYVGAPVRVDNLSTSSGPVSFDRDVIVNDGGGDTRITLRSGSSSRLLTRDVLAGATSSGIVDSSGNLTGSYTQYIGRRGYQRDGTATKAPMAPAALSVQ